MKRPVVTVVPNAPVGTRRATGFVNPPPPGSGGIGSWDEPIFADAVRELADRMRAARVGPDGGAYFSLRAAAKLLGLRAVEVSGVDTGRHSLLIDGKPATPDQYRKLLVDLRAKENGNG